MFGPHGTIGTPNHLDYGVNRNDWWHFFDVVTSSRVQRCPVSRVSVGLGYGEHFLCLWLYSGCPSSLMLEKSFLALHLRMKLYRQIHGVSQGLGASLVDLSSQPGVLEGNQEVGDVGWLGDFVQIPEVVQSEESTVRVDVFFEIGGSLCNLSETLNHMMCCGIWRELLDQLGPDVLPTGSDTILAQDLFEGPL